MKKNTVSEISATVHSMLTFVLIPLGWADQMKEHANDDPDCESVPWTALIVDCIYSAAVWFAIFKLVEAWM